MSAYFDDDSVDYNLHCTVCTILDNRAIFTEFDKIAIPCIHGYDAVNSLYFDIFGHPYTSHLNYKPIKFCYNKYIMY